MIKEWLAEYQPATKGAAEQALREIMQEIALAGLQRRGFFEKAAFYGGTTLRIFYGLDRYSEDLDFSLLAPDPGFSLQPYLEAIQKEFRALGMQVTVTEKKKSIESKVDSAFLKADTIWKELLLKAIIPQEGLNAYPSVKVKLEVDTHPPGGFDVEEKLLVRPFSFYVTCFQLPDLFAGKMHALLFRSWKQRVKGRDWYDMEWYVRRGTPLHLEHFMERASDSGHWAGGTMTHEEFLQLLHAKIDSVSFNRIREDIERFIPDTTVLDIWSPKYFHDLAQKIKIK
jgi:Nucleotidyl transferase AbiEii toxin, Type IV TA system